MCGIAAVIDTWAAADGAGEAEEAVRRRDREVVAMLERIRHRGDPGRFGERWAGPGAALGTNRLAIVDRDHARQPGADPDGAIQLAYNGELYGFLELRAELEGLGHKFHTTSDTEVVVHAYLEWGEAFVARLNGMFAFVLHDGRTGAFLAARDHIGIKPLYYTIHNGVYRFASEQKCLLGHGEPATVLPGTYLTGRGVTRWFELDPAPLAGDDDEIVDGYRELFDAAVRRQVDTDLPVAVMFSGGIDSAAVLHTARRYHPEVTAFTIGFEGAADVEVATRYCAEFGIPHVVSYLDRAALIGAVPEIVYGAEFFESIDVMDSCVAYFGYQLVREHGFKLALCGEGSDEVLAGYDLFRTHRDPAELMRYRVHNLYRTDLQRVDRSSMLNTVETRVPFLDRPLLEFAYSVPMRLKLRDGVEKWILRAAFADRLPPYILHRPKIRMPDGSGLKNTLVEYARQPVDVDGELLRRLNIDTREGAFFLRLYLDSGFPVPRERFKRPGDDYSANGYFTFVS